MTPMQFMNGPTNINGNVSINVVVSTNTKGKSSSKKEKSKRAEDQDGYRDRQLNEHGLMQKNVRIPAHEVVDKSFGRLAEIVREGKIKPEAFLKLVELAENPSYLQAFNEPEQAARPSRIRNFFSALRKKFKKILRFLSVP